MDKATSVEMINDKTGLIQNDVGNVAGTPFVWAPFALLITIYLLYFKEHEKAINEGITKDHDKEIGKIKYDLKWKSYTLSPLERRPFLDILLTMDEDGQRARHKLSFRRSFIKILDRFLDNFVILLGRNFRGIKIIF